MDSSVANITFEAYRAVDIQALTNPKKYKWRLYECFDRISHVFYHLIRSRHYSEPEPRSEESMYLDGFTIFAGRCLNTLILDFTVNNVTSSYYTILYACSMMIIKNYRITAEAQNDAEYSGLGYFSTTSCVQLLTCCVYQSAWREKLCKMLIDTGDDLKIPLKLDLIRLSTSLKLRLNANLIKILIEADFGV